MGAQARDGGVNFAVFSRNAERIELCLFDPSGQREQRRHALSP
jgi:glycogen operon protein